MQLRINILELRPGPPRVTSHSGASLEPMMEVRLYNLNKSPATSDKQVPHRGALVNHT